MAAGLLVLALLFGGGSPFAPLLRMMVELAGVAALVWFVARGWRAPLGRSAKTGLVLIAAIVALIVLQTIPLPPSLWRALPGRAVAAGVLDVVGENRAWLPLSLDPATTREAGLFLIPSIAMFVATLHLDRDAQTRLLVLIAAASILSALLVMVQAQGMAWLTLYETAHTGKGQGIFANKNHDAALLVLSIPLIAMLSRRVTWLRAPGTQQVVAGVLILVLTLAVFGCLSRAGLALLPFALLTCFPLFGGTALVRRHLKIAAALAVIVLVAAVFVAQSTIVQDTLDRFGAGQEGRYAFWPDVIFAIRQFMPWGSGIGTFVPVFEIDESLNAVHLTYTNHAHCDYLEIALEAGIPGIAILLAFLGWFAGTVRTRSRGGIGTPDFALLLVASMGIAFLLVASIVDYPLRTLLLSCVFAVFAGILATPVANQIDRDDALVDTLSRPSQSIQPRVSPGSAADTL